MVEFENYCSFYTKSEEGYIYIPPCIDMYVYNAYDLNPNKINFLNMCALSPFGSYTNRVLVLIWDMTQTVSFNFLRLDSNPQLFFLKSATFPRIQSKGHFWATPLFFKEKTRFSWLTILTRRYA